MKKTKKTLVFRAATHIVTIIILPILFLFALIARFFPKKIDVGIGPVPMINNIYFKKALEKSGYTCETFCKSTYYITQDFDYIYGNNFLVFFIFSLFRYKIIYLYFNGYILNRISLIARFEPSLLRLAKIKTVVMPYGSDCQILELTNNKLFINSVCKDYPKFSKFEHNNIRKNVELWTENSDFVIGAMDSVDYLYHWDMLLPCHFAIDLEKFDNFNNEGINNNKKIKILHAPNHIEIKGSKFIEKAIEELKNEGYEVEYCFVQKMKNNELLKLMKSCDLIIDQLVIGWHGIFALEAMALKKPVICYIREDLLQLYENSGCLEVNELPIINANVRTIKQVIKENLDKKKLEEIGIKSYNYVKKHHSLESIGLIFDKINKKLLEE